MRYIFILFSLYCCSIAAQTNYPAEIEQEIHLVENSLSGRVKVSNKTYNILERMAYYNVKGLSIAVINNYKVLWAKGYGWADEKEKRPVTTETVFQAASISKSFNALAVLKLIQDKKLDLNADINEYLKSWKFPYDNLSKGKKITLTNLLSHTAGLNEFGFPGYERNSKIPSVVQVLEGKTPAITPAVRSEFEPGLKFKYSGGGIVISQLIVSDVTHKPYGEFMFENVFKPLGMLHSSYKPPLDKSYQKSIATGYWSDGSEVNNKFHIYPELGPSGLWSTATDLCQYIIETQLAYEGKSAKILDQTMTKLRLTPVMDNSALGVFIEEHGGVKYFTHGAGNAGFRGQYYGSLEGGNGVVVLTNSDNPNITREIINSVATVYKWDEFYKPIIKQEIVVTDSILKTYEGVYLYDNNWSAIGKVEDQYRFYTDFMSVRMHFSSPESFFNEEFNTEKNFVKDEKGNVTGYIRTANGKNFPLAKKIIHLDTLKLPVYNFENIAWYLFENKKYKECIDYCKRGLQLYPENISLLSKLGYAYLYNKEYDNALNIYNGQLREKMGSRSNWEQAMQAAFVYFKGKGYEVKDFEKVLSDLKIKLPKQD